MSNFYGSLIGFGAGGEAPAVFTVATGGDTIAKDGNYKVHTFTSSGLNSSL